jgi:hypothetical protein
MRDRGRLHHSRAISGTALDYWSSDFPAWPAHAGIRHPHDLLRHAIRFLLVLITRFIDTQFCL